MPGMEILFCLLGGERRVGGDVHMGDEAFFFTA